MTTRDMSARVAILGPGAVGGVIAVGLERAGVRVVCVARPNTADLIRSEGLTLRHGEEVETVRPEVVTELCREVSQFLRDGQIGLRTFVKELTRLHSGSRKRSRRRG